MVGLMAVSVLRESETADVDSPAGRPLVVVSVFSELVTWVVVEREATVSDSLTASEYAAEVSVEGWAYTVVEREASDSDLLTALEYAAEVSTVG